MPKNHNNDIPLTFRLGLTRQAPYKGGIAYQQALTLLRRTAAAYGLLILYPLQTETARQFSRFLQQKDSQPGN